MLNNYKINIIFTKNIFNNIKILILHIFKINLKAI